MLQVTENAAGELQALLIAQEAPADHVVKLVPTPEGQVGMTLSAVAEGDTVVYHGEHAVLLLDERIAPVFEDKTLDAQVVEAGEQRQVQFTIQ